MANISGFPGYLTPNSYSRVQTIRKSVSIPGGLRILAILGLGARQETIVLSAVGGGADGMNPDFNGSDLPDGRHFELANSNVVPGRTTLYLNGTPLTGTESTITTLTFDSKYDYRMEPGTGRIELQRAALADQGGSTVVASTSNVGTGTLAAVLVDINAPAETWTFRATSVVRDACGAPISGHATFTGTGSVSGQPVDAYGAPIVFTSNGVQKSNGVLAVTIAEGATAFDRGDRFTVKVASMVLEKGQTLEATYIAESDLNTPTFFSDPQALFAKHGYPSVDNTLALGASMAFENGAFGVLAVQAAPAMPRRTSEVVLTANDPLTTGTEGYPPLGNSITSADTDAFEFDLNLGMPDVNSEVHLFVIDATSGEETQVFPNKVAFYNSTVAANPYTNFIANSNYNHSYTVALGSQVDQNGVEGYAGRGLYTFTSASAVFSDTNVDTSEEDTNKQIRILDKDVFGNAVAAAGIYSISKVYSANTVTLTSPTNGGALPFAADATNVLWELLDPAHKSARLLLTKDLGVSGTIARGDGLRVTYINQVDADFYDSNWATALDTLQTQNCQMVVPLPDATISAIQQATIAHCEEMSNVVNQRERVALIGAINGVTAEAVIGQEKVAVENIGVLEGIQGNSPEDILAGNIEDLADYSVTDNFGETFRAVYLFPDQIIRVINGSATTLSGYYMAAAVGGWLSGQPNYAMPLTRKILTGFSIPNSRVYKQSMLNALGNAGACVVTPVTGGGLVLHGKTTTSSGAPEEEEISIVFTRDRVAMLMRDVLRSFIGVPEDPTLAAAITSKATKALQALVSQGLITQYQSLTVVRDDVDPRQFNVSVQVQPSYPITWCFVDISLGLL